MTVCIYKKFINYEILTDYLCVIDLKLYILREHLYVTGKRTALPESKLDSGRAVCMSYSGSYSLAERVSYILRTEEITTQGGVCNALLLLRYPCSAQLQPSPYASVKKQHAVLSFAVHAEKIKCQNLY